MKRCGHPTKDGTPCQLPGTAGACFYHAPGPGDTACGRPTSKRTPCTKGLAKVIRWPRPDYVAPACRGHLTREERVALAEVEAYDEAAFRRAHSAPPACHTWPEPEEVDAPDPELASNYLRGNPFLWETLRLSRKMSLWQAERCAICGRQGAPAEDHCHRTGLFRGYLCRSCNTREGSWNTAIFRAYRQRPPAVILGFTYRYIGYGTSQDGAEPEGWVVAALGPVPPDFTPEAVTYLAAAATLTPPPVRMPNLGL